MCSDASTVDADRTLLNCEAAVCYVETTSAADFIAANCNTTNRCNDKWTSAEDVKTL